MISRYFFASLFKVTTPKANFLSDDIETIRMIDLNTLYNRLYRHYGRQHWWPADSDLEMMIGAVLVQNTAWGNAHKALRNFTDFNGERLLRLDLPTLTAKIKPAGSYTRKAQTVLALLRWFNDYGFAKAALADKDTAALRHELLAIHGIGEETCDCILLYAFNRPVFVVDTYLKRLLHKAGHPDMRRYAEIQRYMMDRLPHEVSLFQEYHALIVAYGKTHLKRTALPLPDPIFAETKATPVSLE